MAATDSTNRRDGQNWALIVLIVVLSPIFLYLGGFLLLWLDEVVVKSRLVMMFCPNWVVEMLTTIYWPLLVLLGFK